MSIIKVPKRFRWLSVALIAGILAIFGFLLLKTFAATNPYPVNNLVFDSDRSGNYEIYQINTSGSVTELTNNAVYDSWWPKLSPDGSTLLFYRTPKGTHDRDYSKTSLWVSASDGSNPHQIIANGANGWTIQGHGEWSPDSRRIVMITGSSSGGVLYTTDAAGGTLTSIPTNGQALDSDPSWSPDGKRITYAYNGEVWTVAASGGVPTRITTDSLTDYDPYYSPDGSQIAWLTNISANVWAIRAASSDGSNPHDIINDGNINSKPAWSPDGSIIYFHRHSSDNVGGYFELWMIHPDGSGLAQLTAGTGNNEYPQAYFKPGDINGDGSVDIRDLSILAAHFYAAGNRAQGDLDGSGTIDIIDLSILATHWGS